MHIIRNICVNN